MKAFGTKSVLFPLSFPLSCYLLLFCLDIMASSKTFKDEKTASRFSASNYEFTLTMYKQLANQNKDKNLFYSPFSISAALSMVYLGAKTSTLQQMTKALVLQELGDDIHEAFEGYISDIMSGNENFTLSTANRLYPHQKASLVRDYLNLCTKYYHAEVKPMDFSQSEAARKEINDWVSLQTKNKINDLIPTGVLNVLTVLVLVNAIYFKGNWASQFDKMATQPMPFHISKEQQVNVDMMFQKEKFRYMYNRQMKFAALEMPYKGNSLSMLFILPDEIDGLSALEDKMTADLLRTISKEMSSVKVEVFLPKFKLESSFELSSILGAMGMPDAFDEDKADFSGIVETKDIYISKVFHQGFVEVNEEGAEAAAATAVVLKMRSIQILPKFVVDHPFMFFIRDNRSNTNLFAGRFLKPTSSVTQREEL